MYVLGASMGGMLAYSAAARGPALNRVVPLDLCGGGNVVALRFLRTYLSSVPAVEPEEFTACPVLMLHPAADRWTPLELSLPFFERIVAQKKLVMLRGPGTCRWKEPALAGMGLAFAQFVRELARVRPAWRAPGSGSC